MVKQAPGARRALYEATTILSVHGTDSREVVEYVKKNNAAEIAGDQEALIDLGLMVLAGRVATVKIAPTNQLDIFGVDAPQQFMNFGRKRIRTESLTLDQWESLQSKTLRSKDRRKSHDDIIAACFAQMKAKGLPKNTSLGTFLGRL